MDVRSLTSTNALLSLVSNLQAVSSQLTEQGSNGCVSLATLGHDLHQNFDGYSLSGQRIHLGGHHHGSKDRSRHPPSVRAIRKRR